LPAVFAGSVHAAPSYSDKEVAFVELLNDYRAAKGLSPLLVSDLISEACDRHSSDMGKYKYFSHYTKESDWFAVNATPWDRMAESGYTYYTNKGENIAAGQTTAAQVFEAWKNSPGHNANMLNSSFKVIGVSLVEVPGAPYTFYWTTDFGGYVDRTAHTVSPQGDPGTTRYEQTDSRLVYNGTWWSFTRTGGPSGSTYKRANTNGASVTITFEGTYLAWIATKGTTLGKAYVSLDGGPAQKVDLARSSVAYQQKVWNTGTLAAGRHTVKIWRDPSNIAGKYISVDAVDVIGTLVKAVSASQVSAADQAPTRYEQTDSRLVYAGTWWTFTRTGGPSGGSYKRANINGASVTITFEGTYLAWIATKGTTLGKAYVSLDGGPAQKVDLARYAVAYQQKVWNTGTLAAGRHTVKIWRDPSNLTGKYISLDAVEVLGMLK
jgi:hypothetical protein